MTEETYQRESQFFGMLSHPVRLRILDILAQEEACVCHLTAVLQQRQAYVSQQLATLREAGLITDRKDGLYVYYSLTNTVIAQVLDEARQFLADLTGDEGFLQVAVPVHSGIDCSCPKCQAELLTPSTTT